MSDPITVSLALGVAGNLATNVTMALGERIEDTRLGKALSKLGFMTPGFEARLTATLEVAATNFLQANPSYALPEVYHFLQSKSFARDIKDMIADHRGFDATKLMARLETYIGVPLSEAPESWPNRIDPKAFARSFFDHLTHALINNADNGILWLGTTIAEQGITIRGVARKIDQLLEEQQALAASLTTDDGEDEFRSAYMEHLVGRAQRISTPGARELRGINQSLSVAYISLNLKSSSGAEAIRAETFLAQHSHVTIRGPAGSGKTTLLNWLVTKCDPSIEAVDDKWQGYVPFVIPLRKVARLHNGPPSLSRLVEYSVDEKLWALPTPDGWIAKVVQKQKRAILMIDGVDELPPSRRIEFWEWLADFVNEYPQNRVIVTSRALPGSAEGAQNDQWSPPKVFSDAQLQDMSDADVSSFIHHWHDAIDSTKLDNEELSSLADARATLPAKLEDAANRRIRELCNTPLLCAMICVLHWKEEGYLPRHRVEVYERCCDMLIEARDHKRGVTAPPGPVAAMSKSDKEMVLQQLAIEMMRNHDDTDAAVDDVYRIEISKERALKWIEPRIARFQSPDARAATAVQVLDYLVERTGLLREPAKDLIDFPHRTFQEFLAACAAGAESQESMLARQADDDQWHETIMLAAGTNTGGVGFGRRLIEKLISRGEKHQSQKERSQRIRKTCFALALGCLENLRQQDEELRESVLSHLGELVPPRGDDDARILSVAGDAAVAHLTYAQWKDENTATVAACARALRLIATTEAIKALERGYISDPRQPVVSEVCKTAVFPYASIPVVNDSVLRDGRLPPFVDLLDLQLLVGLQSLKDVSFDATDAKNIEYIATLQEAVSIAIQGVNAKADYLFEMPVAVEKLRLLGSGLPAGDWIGRLPALRDVTVIGIGAVDVARVIDDAPSIEALSIYNSDFSDASTLNRLPCIKSVEFAELRYLESLEPLADNETISSLEVEDCRRLKSMDFGRGFEALEKVQISQSTGQFSIKGKIGSHSKINHIALRGVDGIEDVDFVADSESIRTFKLQRCKALRSIDGLAKLPQVEEIDLSYLELLSLAKIPGDRIERLGVTAINAITNKSFQDSMPRLADVDIERCVKLDNIEFLRNSDMLASVSLTMMPRLSDLSPLSNKKMMTSLTLYDCDGIEDLSQMTGLELESLALISMDNITNFDFISSIQSLKALDLVSCESLRDLSFALELPNLEYIRLHSLTESVHIPESLLPKIGGGPSLRGLYLRSRRAWRYEDAWAYHDYRRTLARRYPRPVPVRIR